MTDNFDFKQWVSDLKSGKLNEEDTFIPKGFSKADDDTDTSTLEDMENLIDPEMLGELSVSIENVVQQLIGDDKSEEEIVDFFMSLLQRAIYNSTN